MVFCQSGGKVLTLPRVLRNIRIHRGALYQTLLLINSVNEQGQTGYCLALFNWTEALAHALYRLCFFSQAKHRPTERYRESVSLAG
jgi:hypothetical protein